MKKGGRIKKLNPNGPTLSHIDQWQLLVVCLNQKCIDSAQVTNALGFTSSNSTSTFASALRRLALCRRIRPRDGRTPPRRRPWRRRGWDPPPAAAGGWEPCCCCRCRGPNVADSGGYNTFFWEKPMVGDIKDAKTHANTANTTKYMQNQKSANITCKYQ